MNFTKTLASIGLALAISAGSAQAGLVFNWSGSTGNAQADAAFDVAALRWSTLFSDNITINVDRGYSALGTGILGSTSISDVHSSYTSVKSALAGDATSASDATATANLPGGSSVNMLINRTSNNPNGSGSATPYLDNNGNTNNTSIDMATANAKALGLLAANNAASDGSITFSTAFSFDFDPTDGITAGEYDFVGVATHEIGHLLGFFSGVDDLEYYAQSSHGGPYLDSQLNLVSTLDLFRFSSDSVQQGAGVIDWTADTRAKYFSINGGATSIADFATGVTYGDGRQASHWKDGLGLGIMDPTAAPGELLAITANDIQALDVIGYNLAAPEPATFLLLGAGLVVLARRRLTS